MQELRGYKEAKTLSNTVQLPIGAYIAKILDCKEIQKENGNNYLAFSFDIVEGEWAKHFEILYTSDINPDKKWKGILNVFPPRENSEWYEQNLSKFKTMMVDFEESNPGYIWDWDETKLKGKLIGVVFGEEEYQPSNSDDIIILSKARYFTNIEAVRSGNVKIPKRKTLRKSDISDPFAEAGFTESTGNEKLPWD